MPVQIDINEAATDNESELLNLARKKFGTLSQAEQKLFEAVANGKSADYRASLKVYNDPAEAGEWSDIRVLKANRIAWLCTDPQASALVTYLGIHIIGARIDGELELQYATISFPLYLLKCNLHEKIHLFETEIRSLDLSGTHTGTIIAYAIKINGELYFSNGFKSEGEVSLLGAIIGGSLNCENGHFINSEGDSLVADRLKVEGDVFLSGGFKAEGGVRLPGATITGNLECDNALFINTTGHALNLEGLKVEGHVFLRDHFKAEGEVRLLGATIGQSLDCSNGQFINPEGYAIFADRVKVCAVFLHKGFKAKGNVRLPGATINGNLECDNGQFINPHGVALMADGLKVYGSLFMANGFKAEGEICLSEARIEGQVDCSGGHFINKNKDGSAIKADGLKVKGEVFLSDGFKAEGQVCLFGAMIGGTLECREGIFINNNEYALGADRIKIEDCAHLCNGFQAEGQVSLVNAKIGGNLNCSKGKFINPEEYSLNCNGLKVDGSVIMNNGFKSYGKVALSRSTIGESLNCGNGHFINKKNKAVALFADGLNVKGDVFLRNGFKAKGEVSLTGSTIGGNLECDNGQFINPGSYALTADGLNVERYVFLRNGFKAKGELRLLIATIGGSLECGNGQFINPSGYAIIADGLKVEGNILFDNGFKAEGKVSLPGATIGGNLECYNGQFINTSGYALFADGLKVERDVFMRNGFKAEGKVSLQGATIGGAFVWIGLASTKEVTLDLRSARIGTLLDDQKSWPEKGKLFINGLVYNEIDDDAPMDAKTRIDWLHRQPTKNFQPQPYQQLAEVFRKAGHDEKAKKVLIAKNKDQVRLTQLPFFERCKYHLLGFFIGYGYRPWQALWIGLIIVLLGSFIFEIGFRSDVFIPTKKGAYVSVGGGDSRRFLDDYPKFNSLVYSFDMFVPLINLHQASYWLPNANHGVELFNIKGIKFVTGNIIRSYMLFHITMGWIITTLFVVGLSGIIRR